MGFLHQTYVIKDAFLSSTNTGLTIKTGEMNTAEAITNVAGVAYNTIYSSVSQSTSAETHLRTTGLFHFLTINDNNIDDNFPFRIYLSEDSNEGKLTSDNLEHIVPKSKTNVSKSFENGKNYCIITYTNSGAEFNVSTVRIAMSLNITTNSSSFFMIYSEPIDPITIGTGETVQIKIEV